MPPLRWPDQYVETGRLNGHSSMNQKQVPYDKYNSENEFAKDRRISARKIIRQRRSALAMDGRSTISKETFYRMMVHVSPYLGKNIIAVLPWYARVSLAIFIHRVDDLPAGLYLLVPKSVSSFKIFLIIFFILLKFSIFLF